MLINRFYDKKCAHNLSDWDRNHTFFSPFFFPDKNPFNSGSESKDDTVKTVTGGLRGLLSHEVRQQQSPQLYVAFFLSQPSLPISTAMGRVCMHMMQVNVRAVRHFSQFFMCVYVCVCPPCYEWAAYQSWSKEHSQQCQACSHHYEQQEHYERMLLAHTVVGLIKPICGPGPNVLTPSSSSSSSISFTKLPCPFEEVALPPYCFLPHGSGSGKGGRGERETGGGRGDGHCWDVGSFHHRRTVAPLHSPAVVVPVEDHAASSPDPPTLPAAPPLQSPSGGDNWELCWTQRQSALTGGVARQHWGVSAASSSFSSCQHVEAVNEGKHRDWELFRVREKSGREVEAKGRETQLWGRGGRKRRCRGRKRARGGIKGGYNPTLWVNAEFFKKWENTNVENEKIKFEDL